MTETMCITDFMLPWEAVVIIVVIAGFILWYLRVDE